MANNSTIKVGNADALKTTFNSLFQQLGVSVDEAFQSAMDEVAKEAVKQLRQTSPKGHGRRHYASGWSYKKANVKKGQFSGVIYNKTKPGVAHLLEHGHKVVDRTGTAHGHTEPQEHIAQVNAWVEQELPKRISQKMSK